MGNEVANHVVTLATTGKYKEDLVGMAEVWLKQHKT